MSNVLHGMQSNMSSPPQDREGARKDRRIWQHGNSFSFSNQSNKSLQVASNMGIWAVARLSLGDKCPGGPESDQRSELAPFRRPLSLPPGALSLAVGPQLARSSDWRANCSHWQRVATTFPPDFLAAAPLILDPAVRASDGFFPTSNLNLKVPASCFPLYQPPKPPTSLSNCPVVNDTTTSQQPPPVPFDS